MPGSEIPGVPASERFRSHAVLYFGVEDIEAEQERLIEHGVKLDNEGRTERLKDSLSALTKDQVDCVRRDFERGSGGERQPHDSHDDQRPRNPAGSHSKIDCRHDEKPPGLWRLRG